MVKIVDGNALNFTENILVHQVNCQGVMGSGIALQIKNKWSNVYESYKHICDIKKNNNGLNELMGAIDTNRICDNKWVYNLFSQFSYGTSKRQTNYIALTKCLLQTFDNAKNRNFTIAMPYKMSCDRAGGNWEYVYNLVCMMSDEYNVDVTIYKI